MAPNKTSAPPVASWWIGFLWPGLAQLWYRGSKVALWFALGASALLNLLVICTFVWPELLPGVVQRLGWWLCLGWWMAAGWISARQGDPATEESASASADLFPRALHEYLKGNWAEAEMVLRDLLALHPHDADAHFLLARVLLRSNRRRDCQRQLRLLGHLEQSAKWESEAHDLAARLAKEVESDNIGFSWENGSAPGGLSEPTAEGIAYNLQGEVPRRAA